MVGESDIDIYLDQLSKKANLDEEIRSISNEQPFLASFLHIDRHSLLSEEEYGFLWFMVVAIYRSFEEKNGPLAQIDASNIEDKEEKIWGLLNDSKERTFRGKLDIFFEMCPEEDLLAFIEDSLTDDEDTIITNAGREFVFVPAATLLFCLSL